MPEAAVERMLPNSREAEQSLLGSVLRENRVIDDVQASGVVVDDFYHDAHRKIFALAGALRAGGKPVEMVTLAERLRDAKQIEDIGGYPYLAELWDMVPTAAHALRYAEIIRDKSMLRALIGGATEILRDAYDAAGPSTQLVEDAQAKMFAIGQLGAGSEAVDMVQAMRDTYQRIDQRAMGELAGYVPTGFAGLDRIIGGLQNGELTILAARPSAGKTALATSLAYQIAGAGRVPSLFVSLEQSPV